MTQTRTLVPTGDQHKLDALIKLLEDEDAHISTVAMEQLLNMEHCIDGILAEFQESHNPILRNRIHQMGNILKIRRSRVSFIESVQHSRLNLWDGIVQINYQFNPRLNVQEVEKMFSSMAQRLPKKLTTARLASFMRKKNFTCADEDVLNADLYLIEEVLLQRIGSPLLLSVIAMLLGEPRGWSAAIVIYKGRHCLLDKTNTLIEPAEDWRMTPLTNTDKIHPCDKNETWLIILCQLFVSAVLEGRLQAIHRVGSLLAELNAGHVRDLPFPLGS